MTPEQTILLDGLKIMGQTFWGPSVEGCTEMMQENYLRSAGLIDISAENRSRRRLARDYFHH